MAQKESKHTYKIYDDQTVGEVQIADDVITAIAALAATEAEGVVALGGGITHEKAARAGARALAKGIQTKVTGDQVSVRVVLTVAYGCSIPQVTAKVQERVKSSIETMTGLTVSDVDICVADVSVANQQ